MCFPFTLVSETTVDDEMDVAGNDIGWSEQFRMAVSMLPSINEDGIQIPLSNMDYALHGLTFFWKLLCAFLPPRKYLGAYPTFFLSLVFIGVLTLLVEEFANQLGCVAGLKTAVTGITLVAIGTSLPDAFASRTAARLDESADNSIGNITGSNSVNVFLGLGLPWLIGAINAKLNGQHFCVATDGVFEATVLFLCTAIICLGLLILRRRVRYMLHVSEKYLSAAAQTFIPHSAQKGKVDLKLHSVDFRNHTAVTLACKCYTVLKN
ncbi:sodium/calcium exchanger 1 [Paragonimus heterotremus]|uniref:Sodium/calcium exchanger 1 n=1 Tax=Paragonimus heterotremus TaxID=100268 RepID=A0A8J4T370_9TREM|nr:sodium/calcium exchanger 1 [Paragonimus heterotremus]